METEKQFRGQSAVELSRPTCLAFLHKGYQTSTYLLVVPRAIYILEFLRESLGFTESLYIAESNHP